MKKSLGRRSSSRNPPRANPFTEFGSAKQDRKSGIPIRRAASTDRNNMSTMATPLTRNIRSTSEDRNSMITYSARSQGFGGGTERPSRATTLSTNSARLSSYGGARKRDNRPIDDKDWQMAAQRRIESFLMQDPEGCHILVNGSIKPITLKMFISIIDLLLRRLDGNEEKTYIHKDNYISELPYVMKKLLYRGKIEKSWLITVNTVRSWSHVLACIDFLVSCVTSQMVIDPIAVMFPDDYDKENDDFWNYKVLLPYFQKSYELFRSNDPKYEEIQEQFDREVIEDHVSNDNVFERITNLQCDIKRVSQETEAMKMQFQKVQQTLQSLDEMFNNLKDEKVKYEEYFDHYNKLLEENQIASENMDRTIEELLGELERHKKRKAEMEKAISNQQLSHCQIAELKQKRDSLQREVKREQEYISKYEELVHKNSLEVLAQKKKIDDLIKKYNIEVIKYLPFQFESVLDAKQDEKEIIQRLDVVQEAINAAKNGIHTLKQSDSHQIVEEIQYEIHDLERKLNETNNKIKSIEEKNINTFKEKEELISKMKDEIDSINEKMMNLKIDPELQITRDEKEKLSYRMEKQLATLKANILYITTECIKIKQEFNAKSQELENEYRMKLNLMK